MIATSLQNQLGELKTLALNIHLQLGQGNTADAQRLCNLLQSRAQSLVNTSSLNAGELTLGTFRHLKRKILAVISIIRTVLESLSEEKRSIADARKQITTILVLMREAEELLQSDQQFLSRRGEKRPPFIEPNQNKRKKILERLLSHRSPEREFTSP